MQIAGRGQARHARPGGLGGGRRQAGRVGAGQHLLGRGGPDRGGGHSGDRQRGPADPAAVQFGQRGHADPAAELPAAALALNAELVAVGPAGPRTVPVAEFLQGPFSTALQPDEILTEIRLPVWHGGHAFVEYARIHANFAVVAVAALVTLDGGRIQRAAVALTGVAPTAIRARGAERALAGAAGDAASAAAAAGDAVEGLTPAGDLHASPATRLALARTYVRRAIELAIARAQNER